MGMLRAFKEGGSRKRGGGIKATMLAKGEGECLRFGLIKRSMGVQGKD